MLLRSCLALLALLALALPADPRPQTEGEAQEQPSEEERREALQRELESIRSELAAGPEPAREARLRIKEGDCLQDLGSYAESVTSYELGAGLARGLDEDNLLVVCLGNVAQSCFAIGSYRQGRAACDEALNLALALGRSDHAWRLANIGGALNLRLADYPAALSAFELALEHLPPDEPGARGLLYNNLANAYMHVGERERAAAMLDQALPLLAQHGGPLYVSAVHANRADLLLLSGDAAGALAPQLEALRLRQEAHAEADVAQSLVGLGRIHFELGQLAEARQELEQALAIQVSLNLQGDQAATLGCLSEVYAKLGQSALAEDSAREGLELAGALDALGQRVETLHSLAKVHESQGAPEAALAALREAVVLERELNTIDVRQRTAQLEQSIELARAQGELYSELERRHQAELVQSIDLARAQSELLSERERRHQAELAQSSDRERAQGDLVAERERRLAELRRLASISAAVLLVAALGGWGLYWSKRRALGRLEAALHEISGLEEERIRAAHLKSLGVLAGGIAHDFNNALTAVLGNVSLARESLAGRPELSAELEACEAAIDQAARLARQLLAFAKGGAPVRELCALGPLVREAAAIAASGSNALLRFELQDNLWLAEVDRGQFLQVISNLVLNAVQAMPQGGAVTLSARNAPAGTGPERAPSGPAVRIEIEDTGPGIPDDLRGKVFDPYFSTKAEGSGLGLTTVHAIVRRHGGEVWLERARTGGARFVVELPAAPDALLPAPPACAAAQAAPLGPARILALDHEASVRGLYEAMLTRLGLHFVLASDGPAAVAEYRHARAVGRPFDLVIVDLTLPGGMGGVEVLEAVRRIDPDALALVASGYSDAAVLVHPERAGFSGALAKPFTVGALAQAIRAALALRGPPAISKAPGTPGTLRG